MFVALCMVMWRSFAIDAKDSCTGGIPISHVVINQKCVSHVGQSACNRIRVETAVIRRCLLVSHNLFFLGCILFLKDPPFVEQKLSLTRTVSNA